MYLAAVIARENGGDLEAFTGDDRYVTDYLYKESSASPLEGEATSPNIHTRFT
jgi:LuxR family maltose regulon positive regulatory protein